MKRLSSPSRSSKKKKQAVAQTPPKLTGVTTDAVHTAWERLDGKNKGHGTQAVLEELKAMGVVPSDTHLKQLEAALCAKRWWTPGKETTPHGSHPKDEWYESRHAAWLEAWEADEDEEAKVEEADEDEAEAEAEEEEEPAVEHPVFNSKVERNRKGASSRIAWAARWVCSCHSNRYKTFNTGSFEENKAAAEGQLQMWAAEHAGGEF